MRGRSRNAQLSALGVRDLASRTPNSLFNYLQPQQILRARSNAFHFALLAAVSVLAIA
jgi:hypothetical protein